MSPAMIFLLQLALGYVPWLLCFGAYAWPRLRAMEPVAAQRAIATLHSFRFFGLVFLVPASSARACRPDSRSSRPTATSQPACWPCSRC